MTRKKFFAIFLLQLIFLTVLKAVFFRNYDYQDFYAQFFYGGITVIVAAALMRRFGYINLLEAIFVCAFWLLGDMAFDGLVTSHLVNVEIFTTTALWSGYICMILSGFIFHKKRHIYVRHQLAAKHKHH